MRTHILRLSRKPRTPSFGAILVVFSTMIAAPIILNVRCSLPLNYRLAAAAEEDVLRTSHRPKDITFFRSLDVVTRLASPGSSSLYSVSGHYRVSEPSGTRAFDAFTRTVEVTPAGEMRVVGP